MATLDRRMSLLISDSVYERLKNVSDKLKRTPSEVVRTSIDEFLNKYEKTEHGLQVEIRQLVQQEVGAALRKREEESNKKPITSISLIKQRRMW
jgi:predicted DNA-binding protein